MSRGKYWRLYVAHSAVIGVLLLALMVLISTMITKAKQQPVKTTPEQAHPAQKDFASSEAVDGTWGGPVGESIAEAVEQGDTVRSQPYHGYYFKILKGQRPAARLGQLDYVVNGMMMGGFALAAAPAPYRVTGVKTFIVSYDGIVHEKDLGPDTLEIFKFMERYNPDSSWRRTDDDW